MNLLEALSRPTAHFSPASIRINSRPTRISLHTKLDLTQYRFIYCIKREGRSAQARSGGTTACTNGKHPCLVYRPDLTPPQTAA